MLLIWEENIWYTLNDKMGWISLENGQVISFEGFYKTGGSLIFRNEDCKGTITKCSYRKEKRL